jgi:cytochrome c biogenesis protein CcmG/thiol:disulfide interchange protein DsbE
MTDRVETAPAEQGESSSGEQGPSRTRRGLIAVLPVAAFGVLAVVFGIALLEGDPSRVPSALIGKKAPEFELAPVPDLKDGGKEIPGLSTADLRAGKVSVVNVWASWCGPCRLEHPFLMQLAAMGTVSVTGINYKDAPENARRFLGLHGNPYSIVGADTIGRTAVDWGVYGVPETFIIDGKGVVRYKHVGPISEKDLNTAILPAIEAARTQ